MEARGAAPAGAAEQVKRGRGALRGAGLLSTRLSQQLAGSGVARMGASAGLNGCASLAFAVHHEGFSRGTWLPPVAVPAPTPAPAPPPAASLEK